MLKFKKLTATAKMPQYATSGSAGMDVYFDNVKSKDVFFDKAVNKSITLKPMQRVLIGTGLSAEFSSKYELQVRPRSGLALKKGITVLNSPGTIDSDYKGEIGVMLINLSSEEQVIEYQSAIAQLVFAKVKQVQEFVNDSDRQGGFGSTDIHNTGTICNQDYNDLPKDNCKYDSLPTKL